MIDSSWVPMARLDDLREKRELEMWELSFYKTDSQAKLGTAKGSLTSPDDEQHDKLWRDSSVV